MLHSMNGGIFRAESATQTMDTLLCIQECARIQSPEQQQQQHHGPYRRENFKSL